MRDFLFPRKLFSLFCVLFIICALMMITAFLLNAAAPAEIDDTEVFFKRTTEVHVPIIMYHLVTEKQKYIGKYGITPQQLREDLDFLCQNNFTTVTINDLINFVEQGTPLPSNPIVLTFDDGNTSDYNHVFPLMKEFDMKAVISIMGKQIDEYSTERTKNPKAKYPNMIWREVFEIHESGRMEIQSHGYDVHGKYGSGKKNNESLEAYHVRLQADLKKLQDACTEHLGYAPTAFTYPLGIMGENSRQVLESLGMRASLSCQEGMNIIRQGDKDCLFKLYRYNRPSNTGIETLINKAIAHAKS